MGVFPFFRLPRELRDRIYAECEGPSKEMEFKFRVERPVSDYSDRFWDDTVNAGATVSSTPLLSLLLISRRFKQEYETEVQRAMVLEVDILDSLSDHQGWDSGICELEKHHELQNCLRWIAKLVIGSWSRRDKLCPDLAAYWCLVNGLTHFTAILKSITNHYVFNLPDQVKDVEPEAVRAIKNISSDVYEDGFPTRFGEVPMKSEIYLRSRQFCVSDSLRPSTKNLFQYLTWPFELGIDDDTLRHTNRVRNDKTNEIVYSAKPSTTEGQFWDLDLSVHRASVVDLDGIIQRVESEHDYKWDERMFELERN